MKREWFVLQISILAMPPYQGQCETNPKVLFKESTHVLGGSFNEHFRMFNPENWGRLPVSIHISLFFSDGFTFDRRWGSLSQKRRTKFSKPRDAFPKE